MDGGFFSTKKKSDLNLATLIKYTKKSESNFFKSYEEMEKCNKKYAKSYADHLEYLELLDDRINFHGMVNVFKKLILKYNIKSGKIDKSSPILFKNYTIVGDVAPSTFRREHITRQLYFLMKKYFNPSENEFIKYMLIENITTTSFLLNITTIDNKNYKNKISHDEFIINKNEVKAALKDIIHTTKQNLKRENRVILFNSKSNGNTKSTSSKKSHTKSNTKSHSVKSNITHSTKKAHSKTKKNNVVVNLLNEANSKQGIDQINSKLQSIFKPKTKPLFSIEKTRGELQKEKKEQDEKEEKERKDKFQYYPETPEGLIQKKCNLLPDKPSCDADSDCFFSPNINKCIRSVKPPGAPPGFLTPIPPPVPVIPGTPGLITIPVLIDSNNEQKL